MLYARYPRYILAKYIYIYNKMSCCDTENANLLKKILDLIHIHVYMQIFKKVMILKKI